jgi:FKBP-type peptidyl-prolyl cis-trans isomerase FklB
MKTISLMIIFSMAAASLLADGTNMLTDEKAQVSYAIGMTFGYKWKQQGIDVDPDLVSRGLKDVQSGGATLLTPQEMQDTLTAFQKNLVASQQKMREEIAAKDQAEGDAFLAQNKKQPDVVTLPDGLQYKVIIDGTGATPAPADVVTVIYSGTFIDGTEFDSSVKTGHPAQFPVGRVIPGWTEALLQMKVGSRWKLFIPSQLAYGEQGRPGIPPNATLIFDVTLLSAQTPNPQPAPEASITPPLTSDIVKVQGTNVQVIKMEDVEKLQKQASP